MYDISAELQIFYDTHVRLGTDLRKQLAEYRELNITRLKNGLDDLAAETDRPHPYPYDCKNQGGYAMHTLNQDPNGGNDYDIDIALIFKKDDIPEDPLQARQRVRDALCKRCTNFTKEPEARTNAVTIWYAEGYHIDFAIYRTYTDNFGIKHIEHASTEWKPRDPMEINNWFSERVSTLSPKAKQIFPDPQVADGQMRRIVRYLKYFCRSRTSWSLPGGMVMSALVAESEIYKANSDRDDLALYDTMVALRNRLKGSCKVYNPVDNSQELTGKTEVFNQVTRLRDRLDTAISKLSVLFDESKCTREKARFALDWIFNHEFLAKKESTKATIRADLSVVRKYSVTVRCDLAKRENGPTYKHYSSGTSVLPKGIALKFSVISTDVPPPYSVRWIVHNKGDEADEANQLDWESSDSGAIKWTSTAFKGNHQMICRIEKNGLVMAEAVHIVKINASGHSRTLGGSNSGFG